MADYWIKLYLEILDDPKMATLPDRLWRRSIEIFLIAGKLSRDKSGQLPETNQLAWLLRMSTDDLMLDLNQLCNAGIINKNAEGWKVVNFEKRQSKVSDADRKRHQRERDQKNEYYSPDNVTSQSRNVTQINRVQSQSTESEAEETATAEIYKAYQNNIGQLSGVIAQKIEADINQYSAEWVMQAIEKATIQEKRSLAYIQGILKGWKRDGKGTPKPEKSNKRTIKIDGQEIEVGMP